MPHSQDGFPTPRTPARLGRFGLRDNLRSGVGPWTSKVHSLGQGKPAADGQDGGPERRERPLCALFGVPLQKPRRDVAFFASRCCRKRVPQIASKLLAPGSLVQQRKDPLCFIDVLALGGNVDVTYADRVPSLKKDAGHGLNLAIASAHDRTIRRRPKCANGPSSTP